MKRSSLTLSCAHAEHVTVDDSWPPNAASMNDRGRGAAAGAFGYAPVQMGTTAVCLFVQREDRQMGYSA